LQAATSFSERRYSAETTPRMARKKIMADVRESFILSLLVIMVIYCNIFCVPYNEKSKTSPPSTLIPEITMRRKLKMCW
jgi:hypothetical protein